MLLGRFAIWWLCILGAGWLFCGFWELLFWVFDLVVFVLTLCWELCGCWVSYCGVFVCYLTLCFGICRFVVLRFGCFVW